MTTMQELPRGVEVWTVDDLDRLPEEDGLHYELIDGRLLVSPSPRPSHQRISRQLLLLLEQARPHELEVFYAPLDWQPDQ